MANTPVEIVLEATDADGDSLSWTIDEYPANGTISATLPEITYAPNSGYSGRDGFAFHMNDGMEDSNTASVCVAVVPIPRVLVSLMASSLPDCLIRLTWQDNSDCEEGFGIERKQEASGVYEPVQMTGPDVTTFTDSGLTEGTTYYYRVYAFKSTGDSDFLEEAAGIPQDDPFFVDFFISPGPHAVRISFKARDDATSKIEYGVTASYGNETGADSLSKEHNFIIDGLDKDREYYFRVIAITPPVSGFNRTFKTKNYYVQDTYADTYVESYSGCNCSKPGDAFGDPIYMLNDVTGTDGYYGSLDVFSLRYCDPDEIFASLRWSGRVVQNGPGTDFVFFENGFKVYDTTPQYGNYFMEPVVVFLSRDGDNWVAMPHDYNVVGYEKNGVPANETQFIADASAWSNGFGGVWPVFFHCEDNPVDPFYFNGFDPGGDSTGGDHFDMDALSDEGEAGEIKRNGFKYLKFVSAWLVDNPDTGVPFPFPDNGSFDAAPDCDGIYARYFMDE